VLDGSIGGLVDCAIASIDDDITKVHEIVDIGAVAGSGEAVVGDAVRKRGRTTGLTEGEVIDVASVTTSSAGHSFTDQLRIAPTADHPRWSNSGDSGSAVVNEDNQVVGIHWGGSDGRGTASKIDNVMTAMDINIPGAVGDADELTAAAHDLAAVAAPRSNRAAWQAVVNRFMNDDSPLTQLVRRHHAEVWGLIRQRRAVTVVWHRRQGPAFVAAFHRTATTPGYRVPEAIHDASLAGLLLGMAATLEEHGTPALRRDLVRHALPWISQLQECRTATELMTVVEAVERQLDLEGEPVERTGSRR
jgi:hypothetical protein